MRGRVDYTLSHCISTLIRDIADVGYSEAIQFDELSAFRPCACDLVELFNCTGWALYVKLT